MRNKYCMYAAKDLGSDAFIGLSFAKLTDIPVWCFVQTHGFFDGQAPQTLGMAGCQIDKPIAQSFFTTEEDCQYHDDGYTVTWASDEGRRVWEYRRIVFDDAYGVWGTAPEDGKPGEPFEIKEQA